MGFYQRETSHLSILVSCYVARKYSREAHPSCLWPVPTWGPGLLSLAYLHLTSGFRVSSCCLSSGFDSGGTVLQLGVLVGSTVCSQRSTDPTYGPDFPGDFSTFLLAKRALCLKLSCWLAPGQEADTGATEPRRASAHRLTSKAFPIKLPEQALTLKM